MNKEKKKAWIFNTLLSLFLRSLFPPYNIHTLPDLTLFLQKSSRVPVRKWDEVFLLMWGLPTLKKALKARKITVGTRKKEKDGTCRGG